MLTGAAVGLVAYAGMTKYDNVRNVIRYHKTSVVENIAKNAKLDENYTSLLGEMSQEDLIRYDGGMLSAYPVKY